MTHDLYLGSEAVFLESCLKLLEIDFTQDDNAKSEDTGMTVYRFEYDSNDMIEDAIGRMFRVWNRG